ncbi:unnamed protein product [Rotaria sp. Silwood1]|nr:unnamed protein product [Rotaria sp. Silwood1]
MDERFEEIYRPDDYAIRLVDDSRTCEKIKAGSFGCALGHHSYSSGIHRIPIRIDYGRAFLGIRSRNTQPVSDEFAWGRYDCSPSTYGWIRDCGRICNGHYIDLGMKKIERDNHVFVLTLNCNEHRLSILNENTKEQDEMKDGDIDRDSERFEHSESYDIIDEKLWHHHPNGTCRYFYFHHHGSLGKYHGLDICRCP